MAFTVSVDPPPAIYRDDEGVRERTRRSPGSPRCPCPLPITLSDRAEPDGEGAGDVSKTTSR